MSQDELKRDVNRIFSLAAILAKQDGLAVTALRDLEMMRSYVGRAVACHAESVCSPELNCTA